MKYRTPTVKGVLAICVLLGTTAAYSAQAQDAEADSSQPQKQGIELKQVDSQTGVVDGAGGTAEREIETVEVTGSRIRRAEYLSNSPISAVNEEDIKFQGANSVDSVLNKMPQFTADANENVSNGSDGTAQVNLRNLGSNRVLTLINGRRILPTMATDINFIPSAMVERIDVVTGGASAVYGSDAISGVVNFVLKDDLNGVILDTQGSAYQHDNDNDGIRDLIDSHGYQNADSSVFDGEKFNFSFAAGTDFADDRGNITFYTGYQRTEAVTQNSRDYSACALFPNSTLDGLVCGGSGNNPWGRFFVRNGENAGGSYNNVKDGGKTWDDYSDDYLYNYAPLNYILRDDTRHTAGVMTHYDLSDDTEVYGSFMFMDDHSFSQVAPSALWFGSDYAINCDNPLMSDQQASLLCGSAAGSGDLVDVYVGYRLDGENARPRRDDLRHTDYRFNLGISGDIVDGITYDASYLRSQALFQESYHNDVNIDRATRALLAVEDDNGNIVCQSVLDGTDEDCIPIDVFAYSGLSTEAYDYILTTSSTESSQTLDVLSAYGQIDLDTYGIRLPWAPGPTLVIGGEHREEVLDFDADAIAESYGSEDSYGKIAVDEFYTEMDLPLVEGAPGIQYLGLNTGYRLSDYTNSGEGGDSSHYSADTYKFELTYAPVDGIRLRSSFNRAIRAPNVSELFDSRGLGNYAGSDPCAGSDPSASLEECMRSGVTAAQYGNIVECPADVCVTMFGGNPNLKPEQADTLTFGVVLTPGSIEDLSLSLDYYEIRVDDYVGSIDPTLILNQCLSSNDSYYCDLVHRSDVGTLFGTDGYVISTNLNTGYLQTSGMDVNATYDMDIGEWGSLNFSLVGTWLKEKETQPQPGSGAYDCRGLFGPYCGQPSPKWRHNARTTWSTPWNYAQLSLLWRYYGGVDLSTNSGDPLMASNDTYRVSDHIDSYSYFDLAGNMTLGDHLTLRAGINNLLDKSPPAIAANLLTAFGNGNTYPGIYDPLGRHIYLAMTANF